MLLLRTNRMQASAFRPSIRGLPPLSGMMGHSGEDWPVAKVYMMGPPSGGMS
jgi:hypothetical protein